MNYDDIINMEHHTSRLHQRMTIQERAAQFSPFAALTGFEDVIGEAEKNYLDSFSPQDPEDVY